MIVTLLLLPDTKPTVLVGWKSTQLKDDIKIKEKTEIFRFISPWVTIQIYD